MMLNLLRASLAAGWLLVGLVAYWLFVPYRVYDPFDPAPRILTPVVKRGSTLLYSGVGCKRLAVKGISSRSFVDGIVYLTPPVGANRPLGCLTQPVGIAIPKSLPVGHYRLEGEIMYEVNPIRTVTYHYRTGEFEVVP